MTHGGIKTALNDFENNHMNNMTVDRSLRITEVQALYETLKKPSTAFIGRKCWKLILVRSNGSRDEIRIDAKSYEEAQRWAWMALNKIKNEGWLDNVPERFIEETTTGDHFDAHVREYLA